MEKTNKMYWWGHRERIYNFGDLIGPYLYYKITGNYPVFTYPNDTSDPVLSTVGSILHFSQKNSIIWGSGFINESSAFVKPLQILHVRGPLTHAKYIKAGIKCPEIYGDPALLLPQFYNPIIEKKYKIGIIPHFREYDEVKKQYNNNENNNNIKIIKLKLDTNEYIINIESIIDDILTCEYIISSSLHGIICAHAYNIPTAWVIFSDKNDSGVSFKYLDYYLSRGVSISGCDCVNMRKIVFNVEDILKIIKQYPQPDPKNDKINLHTLLEICPF